MTANGDPDDRVASAGATAETDRDADDEEPTLPTKEEGSDGGDEAERVAGEDTSEEELLARIGTAVAWVVGAALIAVGLLGFSGGGPGIVPLALGLFVTPRTRRELTELCRLLCGAGG